MWSDAITVKTFFSARIFYLSKLFLIRFRNDIEIVLDDRVKIDTRELKGEKISTLNITEVKPEDAGLIKLVAKNPAGEDKCQAKINVKGKVFTE